MTAMELLPVVQVHDPQDGANGPLARGCGKAPARSTWACRQTRLENSGAKGGRTRIIALGTHLDHLSLSRLVTKTYPTLFFLTKWLESNSRRFGDI
jgi:hypothetical protein